MDRELLCKVCEKTFENPVVLPCGDCICFECVSTKLALDGISERISTNNQHGRNSSNDKRICHCPVCMTSISLPPNGIMGLPRYGIIEDMIKDQAKESGNGKYICCF